MLGTMKMDVTPCSLTDFLLTFEKGIASIFGLPFYPEEGGSTFLRTCSKENHSEDLDIGTITLKRLLRKRG
jgi:hypothetical protein